MKFKKGIYIPFNKKKFIIIKNKQNGGKINYRSSWEFIFLIYCDLNSNISNVISEPFLIKYKDTMKNKIRNYYPDFLIKMNDKWILIEIKPLKKINEKLNKDKFVFAKKYCDEKNMTFKLITEKEIEKMKKFLKKKNIDVDKILKGKK